MLRAAQAARPEDSAGEPKVSNIAVLYAHLI
jgi:hypothetical protein